MSHAGSHVGDNIDNNEVNQDIPPPIQQQLPPPPLPQIRPPRMQLPQQPLYQDNYDEEYYEEEYIREPTMGELSAPNFRNQPWCIYEGPELAGIVINTAVVHHLPKFSGRQGESATAHLQRYHGICQNLRPYGVEVEDFKLKAFYFSLIDAANDWFLSLPSGSIQTWDQMQKKFLNKYYPAGRAMQVRRQLQDLKQGPNETMYEYVEKFNALEQSCCNLGLPEKLIVEYMLDGLRPLDRSLLDASAGGTIMNLSPAGARRKIMEVAENARFRDEAYREEEFGRTRNVSRAEPPSSSMAEELRQMKEMMMQLMRREPVQVKPCEFCGAIDHKTDACPSIVHGERAEVHAVDGYQNCYSQAGPSRPCEPSRQYDQNWRNNQAPREHAQQATHQQAPHQQAYRPPFRQQQGNFNGPSHFPQRNNQAGQIQPSKSLEDIVKEMAITIQQNQARTDGAISKLAASTQQLATTMQQYQTKTDGAISDMTKQMSQVATTVSELNRDPGKRPAQTEPNLKANICTMATIDTSSAENVTDEIVPSAPEGNTSSTLRTEASAPMRLTASAPHTPIADATQQNSHLTTDAFLSFSMQVSAPDKHATDTSNFGTDRLKAMLEQNDPTKEHPPDTSHEAPTEKSKDPGAFTVTCGIGETLIPHCLIDLGASVNAMPYALYCSLKLGPLKPPGLLITLGDKSCINPVGLLKGLTVRVGDIIVPADFYILQMPNARHDEAPALILGRPFLFATKTKIDMDTGQLSLAFGGKTADFYIYGDDDRPCTKKPPDIVHEPYLGVLPLKRPDETMCATRPVAMSKMSSPTQEYVKANPPDRWRADPSTSLQGNFGQIEEVAEEKFDLTRPWDPNL